MTMRSEGRVKSMGYPRPQTKPTFPSFKDGLNKKNHGRVDGETKKKAQGRKQPSEVPSPNTHREIDHEAGTEVEEKPEKEICWQFARVT
jgi:hypothetical protein